MAPRPPPPPGEALADAAREQLLAELRALETPELLALCLEVKGSLARLRVYLGLLRGRGGARAQLASCLVCFDLAQRGDALAQREFTALAPTILELSRDQAAVDGLLAGDRYLLATWGSCREALLQADPREDRHALEDEAVEVAELDLLSEEDLDLDLGVDFDFELEPAGPDPARVEQARAEFTALLWQQMGLDAESGEATGEGFATASSKALDKLEGFLREAEARAALLPSARGMASLGWLYLATHLRQKGLFGRRNARRDEAVRQGLASLPADVEAWEQAGASFAMQGGTVAPAFEKVLELVLDYLAFCLAARLDPRSPGAVSNYVAADRQPRQVLLSGDSRRRRG